MYSEEDDPSWQRLDDYEKRNPSPPFLKLYEEEEGEALSLYHRVEPESTASSADNASSVVQWRCTRFLHIIKGFHVGSLDLTGRHEWRYMHYLPRWERYLKDFQKVAKHTLIEEKEESYHHPKWTQRYKEYSVTKPKALDAFYAKWTPAPPWSYLYPTTMAAVFAVAMSPKPKFQQLLLIHLPTELLDRIFFFASESQRKASLLGMTCRLLRQISLRYIYKDLTIGFGPKSDKFAIPESDEDLDASSRKDKEAFVNKIDSLLARPDRLQAAVSMVIYDRWQSFGQYLPGGAPFFSYTDDHEYGIDIDDDFYAPIFTKTATLVTYTVNVTKMRLTTLLINPSLMSAIASLPCLHSIGILSCNFSTELQRFPVTFPSSPSILNLVVDLPALLWNNHYYWSFLSMCRQVRNLTMAGYRNRPLHVPLEPGHRALFNFWSTVERLSVESLAKFEVQKLSWWIEEAKAISPLRLTHVKILTPWPIERDELFGLIDALRGAPLEVLGVSRIRYAGLDLIDRIAEAFPDLLGLTLIHYWRYGETDGGLSMWPHASWEYAPRLRGFRRLEHLALNMYSPTLTDYLDSSHIEQLEGSVEYDEIANWAWYDPAADSDTVVRVFALHCPTLRSFTFWSIYILRPNYEIARREDGYPIVKGQSHKEKAGTVFHPIPLKYYPMSNGPSSPWPSILPEDAPDL